MIWHTTGSGKSLTMVMLAKALVLAPDIHNPKIVLVTDRVDLDDQIYKTFHACGKPVVQAKTGGHLIELIAHKKASYNRGLVYFIYILHILSARKEYHHQNHHN